jgi:hypothetical protein
MQQQSPTSFETICAAVRASKRELELVIRSSDVLIANYRQDGAPLEGWSDPDPELAGSGRDLEEAWASFLVGAATAGFRFTAVPAGSPAPGSATRTIPARRASPA